MAQEQEHGREQAYPPEDSTWDLIDTPHGKWIRLWSDGRPYGCVQVSQICTVVKHNSGGTVIRTADGKDHITRIRMGEFLTAIQGWGAAI